MKKRFFAMFLATAMALSLVSISAANVVCSPSSRQGNNLHFTHEISAYQPYRADTGLYAASRQSWTSIGVRTPNPRWRRRKL